MSLTSRLLQSIKDHEKDPRDDSVHDLLREIVGELGHEIEYLQNKVEDLEAERRKREGL